MNQIKRLHFIDIEQAHLSIYKSINKDKKLNKSIEDKLIDINLNPSSGEIIFITLEKKDKINHELQVGGKGINGLLALRILRLIEIIEKKIEFDAISFINSESVSTFTKEFMEDLKFYELD